MSIQEKLKHELKAIVMVTLLFAAWLGILMVLKILLLEDYRIRVGGFSMVMIGALLFYNLLSAINRHLGSGGLAEVFLSPPRELKIP